MKQLYTKTVQVFEVNALTYPYAVGLEEFIQQCYNLPKPFEITECSSNTYHRFEIDRKPLDAYDLEDANEAIANGNCPIYQLRDVLRQMCCDGFIEPGIYLVNMSW